MKNLTELFKRLGLDGDKGLYLISENTWQNECGFSSRIARLLEDKIQPDAFFCFDSKPLILFYENPTDKKRIYKAVWNFNESPIVFIFENGSVDIFNGFEYIKNEETLKFIGKEEKLNDFTYFELVTGKTWEKYESKLKHENRVDYFLLKNIKSARSKIVKKAFPDWSPKPKRKKTDEELKIVQLANNFIGKVIFVSYLIDRNVEISFEGKKKKWKRSDFCSLLKDVNKTKMFFNFLKQEDQFNGDDLFPITDDEFDIIKKYNVNKILIDLLNGVELSTGQQSLFDIYDFSIIPVEFISNVYESFIGESNQAKEGAYYTPLFLVEYIISQTLKKYFEENDKKYECKVLDPACGSGIFLVESLRVMINRYMILDKDWGNDIPKFQSEIKRIAKKNIYGVDKDPNAINVAIFSVYLTLLDYQNPKDIEDFQFPNIRNSNFVERDFFADTDDINNLKTKGFDFIVGNPPWKRGGKKDEKYLEYIDRRKKNEGFIENPIDISNKEIAQAFIFRVSDFSTSNNVTRCALIATSKVLYNVNADKFRTYLRENYFIDKILELAPVGNEVFQSANSAATVLFYRYSRKESTSDNIVKHYVIHPNRFFSLFKKFTFNRQNIKTIQQNRFKHDWLWKTLIYGNYLDFNLVKRIKELYNNTILNFISQDEFLFGQGIQVSGGDKNDMLHLTDRPYLNIKTDFESFLVKLNINQKWPYPTIVHRNRKGKELLFQAPILLIKHGLDRELKAVAAICKHDALYVHSLTGIKPLTSGCNSKLSTINALVCSGLFSYFMILCTSASFDRRRAQDEEKFSFPFIDIDFEKEIIKIEEIKKLIHLEKSKVLNDNITISQLESTAAEKLAEINTKIFESLNINNQEQAIIDYALNVNRPIIINDKTALKKLCNNIPYQDEYLENNAKLFIDRFKSNLNDDEKKFIVEIWHSNQIIGMFFKMIPVSEYEKDIVWKDKSNNEIMKIVADLSSEKITESLFVQKDVRGFEEEYFYVFKPNEKRLWHKAIGYLDVDEFMDALLLAGKGGKHE